MKNQSFNDLLEPYDWDQVTQQIYDKGERDVIQALSKDRADLEDLKALVSPAATPYLEQMAQKSQTITQQRFGKTIRMYVPLYLSNYCSNGCVYCGFNAKNKIPRKKLTTEEVLAEANQIIKLGFKSILLVTGEDQRRCNTEYLKEIITLLNPMFDTISIEVQPMDTEDYSILKEVGLHAVYVYQETYHQKSYPDYHAFGRKRDFKYRLTTPERIAEAGVHKLGFGALLGLEEWRTEAFFIALHLSYMEKKHWQTQYSISFPRLRPHAGNFPPQFPINDTELLKLICAFRIFNPYVELTLSTRESAFYRDNLLSLGVTSMSAGSKTEPGGYVKENKELKQFEIEDARSVEEVVSAINERGYEVVWKDWDTVLA
ncbi:2-iminoacetate synthase ThiH [Halosquirtibacter xylanolyticus]|uniref:2-iminoacetate synthase ThiH n=1 Tax=Halosquirtibacter xylanolyticus TaxID=3374599 RepID=UPI003749D87E|nr:2-iminoacetate synthase ThiH [Prolixibacteraceae bacterium]